MANITEEDFNLAVQAVIGEVQELFKTKNGTYKSKSDPLANFTNGGLLLLGDGSMKGKYEALKGYVTKHIVTAIHNDIDFPKLEESTRDIAVYFIIATAMAKLNRENKTCKDCMYEIHKVMLTDNGKNVIPYDMCNLTSQETCDDSEACEDFAPRRQ